MSGHLTDNELIDRLYGIDTSAEARESHLLGCAACADKLRWFERRRAAGIDFDLASPAFLAVQRSQIRERVQRRHFIPGLAGFRLHWVPAVLASALVAAVALFPHLERPAPAQAPDKAVQQEAAEEQLFNELFALEVAEEPRAASPIRGLFQAGGSGE